MAIVNILVIWISVWYSYLGYPKNISHQRISLHETNSVKDESCIDIAEGKSCELNILEASEAYSSVYKSRNNISEIVWKDEHSRTINPIINSHSLSSNVDNCPRGEKTNKPAMFTDYINSNISTRKLTEDVHVSWIGPISSESNYSLSFYRSWRKQE